MPKKTKKHILMIDDDATTQQIFGAKFSHVGFEVLYAHSGDEGREMARRFKPDVILLDIRMPEEDGYAVAQSLHQTEATKDIPIIFLTNEDLKPEAVQWTRELWIRDYMHKSTDLSEVVARVQKVIDDTVVNSADNQKPIRE